MKGCIYICIHFLTDMPYTPRKEKNIIFVIILKLILFLYCFSEKVIVYGQSLDAYTCVQTLLSMGVSGDRICMVQPPAQYEVGLTYMNNILVIPV